MQAIAKRDYEIRVEACLRSVTPGGGICETISRMDYAYELQDKAFFLASYAP